MRAMESRLAGAATQDTLHSRLRAAREHARLAEDEAAGLAGITVRKLQSMERGSESGRTNSTPAIAKLAAAYGVSSVWLAAGRSAGSALVPDWYHGERA